MCEKLNRLHQANSNRISHKKGLQKSEFPLCGHEFENKGYM